MAKELLNLAWIDALLPDDVLRKRMFGGFSYYSGDKLVLLLFESTGDREYRGQQFDFEIWNGCMFPVEKELQSKVFSLFPFLSNHPVLPKWLYLPAETEDFENLAETVIREIKRQNPLFGTIVKERKAKNMNKGFSEKIDTRRPRMFGEEPPEIKLKTAKRISDLKNFGPETEKTFLKAGIKTPQQFIKLGWKKTIARLCKVSPKNNHSIFAYATIGALENKMWNLISEESKLEAREFMKSLRIQKIAKPEKKPKAKLKKKAPSKK